MWIFVLFSAFVLLIFMMLDICACVCIWIHRVYAFFISSNTHTYKHTYTGIESANERPLHIIRFRSFIANETKIQFENEILIKSKCCFFCKCLIHFQQMQEIPIFILIFGENMFSYFHLLYFDFCLFCVLFESFPFLSLLLFL